MAVGCFYNGRKKFGCKRTKSYPSLWEKELAHGKGTLWCETSEHLASCTNEHRVDCSGDEDLTDDQEEEIWPEKKTSLAEEKHERVQKLWMS